MAEKTNAKEIKTVKVKLKADHEHGGMKYSAGAEIVLPEHDAVWLKNLKIAEEIETTAAITPSVKIVEEK